MCALGWFKKKKEEKPPTETQAKEVGETVEKKQEERVTVATQVKERSQGMETPVKEEKAPEKPRGAEGKELVTCAFCGGRGIDPYGIMSSRSTCYVCMGRKQVWVSTPHKRCVFCGGKGKDPAYGHRVHCSVCRGYGVVHVPKHSKECPDCRGIGARGRMRGYCLACKGIGEVAAAVG